MIFQINRDGDDIDCYGIFHHMNAHLPGQPHLIPVFRCAMCRSSDHTYQQHDEAIRCQVCRGSNLIFGYDSIHRNNIFDSPLSQYLFFDHVYSTGTIAPFSVTLPDLHGCPQCRRCQYCWTKMKNPITGRIVSTNGSVWKRLVRRRQVSERQIQDSRCPHTVYAMLRDRVIDEQEEKKIQYLQYRPSYITRELITHLDRKMCYDLTNYISSFLVNPRTSLPYEKPYIHQLRKGIICGHGCSQWISCCICTHQIDSCPPCRNYLAVMNDL